MLFITSAHVHSIRSRRKYMRIPIDINVRICAHTYKTSSLTHMVEILIAYRHNPILRDKLLRSIFDMH